MKDVKVVLYTLGMHPRELEVAAKYDNTIPPCLFYDLESILSLFKDREEDATYQWIIHDISNAKTSDEYNIDFIFIPYDKKLFVGLMEAGVEVYGVLPYDLEDRERDAEAWVRHTLCRWGMYTSEQGFNEAKSIVMDTIDSAIENCIRHLGMAHNRQNHSLLEFVKEMMEDEDNTLTEKKEG